MNRATGEGYWKMTGKDREVMHGNIKVGIKKTLVYYKGRAPRGEHTDWIMHEYRLTQNYEELKSLVSCHVLCKVFKKGRAGPRNGEKHGAPLIDEEELGSDISPKSQSNLFTLVAPELEPETSNWHFENQTKTSNWHIKDIPKTSYRHIQNQPEMSNWHIEDQPETSNRHIKNRTEKSYSHIQNQPEMIYTHIEDRPETIYRHMENEPEMSYRNIENQPKMSYMHIENQPEMSYRHIENHPETSDRNIENQTGASYRHIENQTETNNRHIKSQPEMSYRLVQNQPDARNRHIKNPPETSYSYVKNQPEMSNRHIQNQIRTSNWYIENQSTKVLPLKPLLMQKLGKPSMPEHSPRKKGRKELLSSLDMTPSSSGVCNEPNIGHENNCDDNSILEQMLLEASSNPLLPENHGGLDDDNDEWLDFLELADLEEEGESSFPVASSILSSDAENPEETGILLRTSNKGGGDGEAARTRSQFNHKSRLRMPISSFGGAIACNRDTVANHQCRDILDLPPTGYTNFSTNMEKSGERMINHMDSNGDDNIQEFENVSKTCSGRIFRGSFHMNSDDEDNTTERRIPEPKRSAKHGFVMNRREPNILEKTITAFQYHDGFMSSAPEESAGGGFMMAVSGVGQCVKRLLVSISTQVWRNFLLPYSRPTLFSRF